MKKQSGFTLLEMSLVLLVMAAIAIPATEGIKQQVRKLKLERGAREVVAIQEAGLRYYQDNGSWPANINTLVNTNYLPAGSTVSPWGSAYTTSASGNNFTVSVNTDANAQATRLQSRLPFTSTTNRTVRSTVGIPGTETAHLALTPRDGSRAWTGSHNAGGNSLSNVNTASVARVNASNEVTAPRFADANNTAFAVDPASTSTVNRIDATSQMRAPIVFDSNNPAYYTNPAGASVMNDVRANIFYDLNNTGFYVNPASTSVMNDVRGSIFYDRDNTGYYVNPNSVSVMHDVRASILYDRNNTAYYVNPAGTSRTNLLYTNRIRLASVNSIGQSCTTGYVARSSTGELMSCVNGRYKQVGSHGSISYYTGVRACGSHCVANIPGYHHLCVTQTNEVDSDTEGGGGYAWRIAGPDNRGRWRWQYVVYDGDEGPNRYVVSCLNLG